MIEMFVSGLILGVSLSGLALIIGITVYVRVRGAFTVGPPTQPLRGLSRRDQ